MVSRVITPSARSWIGMGDVGAVALLIGALVPLALGSVGPVVLLGALIGLAAVVVLALDWRIGPILLGAALPFENLVASDGIASGMKLLTAAAVGSLLLHALWNKDLLQRLQKVLTDTPTVILACLLGWSLLSVMWARVPGAAVTRSTTLLGVGVLMVLVAMLREKELGVLWNVIFVSSVASVAVALIAGPPAPERVTIWTTTARFTSGGHHPVDYGGILVVIGVIGFLGLRWGRLTPLRYFSLMILTVGLLSTGTRAAIVALAFVPLLIMLLKQGGGERGSRFSVAGLIVVLLFSAAAVVRFLPSTASLVGERYASLQNVSSADTWTGRLDLWAGAVEVFTENPVTGIGAGNFPLVAPQYSGFAAYMVYTGTATPVAHNAILSIASELGLGGLAIFLTFWGTAIKRAWTIRFGSRLGTALAVGLGCYFLISMSLSWEFIKLPYVLFGSLASIHLGPGADTE